MRSSEQQQEAGEQRQTYPFCTPLDHRAFIKILVSLILCCVFVTSQYVCESTRVHRHVIRLKRLRPTLPSTNALPTLIQETYECGRENDIDRSDLSAFSFPLSSVCFSLDFQKQLYTSRKSEKQTLSAHACLPIVVVVVVIHTSALVHVFFSPFRAPVK